MSQISSRVEFLFLQHQFPDIVTRYGGPYFSEKLYQGNSIDVKTNGGMLSVSFEEFKGSYRNIWLSGEANMVYAGEFEC